MEKTCANCAWLGNGICNQLRTVPMSIDGKGRRNCSKWEHYKPGKTKNARKN